MNTEPFLSKIRTAFDAGQLLKCTLSRPHTSAPPDLKNIYIRPVEIKSALKLSFTYHYKTRDEVKNFDASEALALLRQMLGTIFLNADLFTTEEDITLSFTKNGAAFLKEKKPSLSMSAETVHNREKHRLLAPTAPWLHVLGITNVKGEVLPKSNDKWRQINKFLEIIEGLLKSDVLPVDPHIADMGSGKGYLTFALYDYLKTEKGLSPQITGIELRPELVNFCNLAARQSGFEGLQFVASDIRDYAPERLDMLIALHACDTATDLALAKGIQAKARLLVVAPCCHKQIRKEMGARNELAPVLRHGILEERQAEIVTDGIRALLLEAEGYKTNVFEFVSTEHTAKNVMITAVDARKSSTDQRQKALSKVAALKEGFGIRQHYLEKLLSQ